MKQLKAIARRLDQSEAEWDNALRALARARVTLQEKLVQEGLPEASSSEKDQEEKELNIVQTRGSRCEIC